MPTEAKELAKKLELAEKFMKVTGMEKDFLEAFDSSVSNTIGALMQVLSGGETKKESTIHALGDAFKKIESTLKGKAKERSHLMMSQFRDAIVKLYSTEELEAVIEFYTSSLGKSFLKKQAQLKELTIPIGKKWGESLTKDVEELLS